MRKTEMVIGVLAGTAGVILGLLFLFELLPVSPLKPNAYNAVYAGLCIGGNVIGFVGGLLVGKRHFLGSAFMAAAMFIIMFFGFPWQMIPAVAYIVCIVLAVVPEKLHD